MRVLCVCAALLVSVSPGVAEIFEFELTGLPLTVTSYDTEGMVLTTTLNLSATEEAVTGVSVRLVGTALDGLVLCIGDEEPYPVSAGVFVTVEGGCEDPSEWTAQFKGLDEGEFDVTVPFKPSSFGACNWSFLSDGSLDIEVRSGVLVFLPGCHLISRYLVTVDHGSLLVEVGGETPVAPTGWDRVKALYR